MTEETTAGKTRKRRRGCLWAAVVPALLLITIAGYVAIRASSCESKAGRDRGVDEYPDLKEVWSCGSGDTKVVRIPLTGLIMLDEEAGGFLRPAAGSAAEALRSIQRATHDTEVRALILEIDSGGGGITASDIIYEALQEFKDAQDGRKIVVICGDVVASGAYYIAMASDYIIVHPTTITGSIGVLMESLNVQELAKKIGVKDVTIKSGKNKDILNPFEDLTPEQRTMLQGLIDDMYDRFVKLVADGRNLSDEEVRTLADGSVFTASKAVDLGLVDEVGYWQDAMSKVNELLLTENVKVYRYEQKFSLTSFLEGLEAWSPLRDMVARSTGTRFMYLWKL